MSLKSVWEIKIKPLFNKWEGDPNGDEPEDLLTRTTITFGIKVKLFGL